MLKRLYRVARITGRGGRRGEERKQPSTPRRTKMLDIPRKPARKLQHLRLVRQPKPFGRPADNATIRPAQIRKPNLRHRHRRQTAQIERERPQLPHFQRRLAIDPEHTQRQRPDPILAGRVTQEHLTARRCTARQRDVTDMPRPWVGRVLTLGEMTPNKIACPKRAQPQSPLA